MVPENDDRDEGHPNGSSREATTRRIAVEVRRTDARLVTLVRRQPLAAVGVALLAGYLVGRLVNRFG